MTSLPPISPLSLPTMGRHEEDLIIHVGWWCRCTWNRGSAHHQFLLRAPPVQRAHGATSRLHDPRFSAIDPSCSGLLFHSRPKAEGQYVVRFGLPSSRRHSAAGSPAGTAGRRSRRGGRGGWTVLPAARYMPSARTRCRSSGIVEHKKSIAMCLILSGYKLIVKGLAYPALISAYVLLPPAPPPAHGA